METEEETEARKAKATDAMAAAGVSVEEHVQVDYFGFEETFRVMLPDDISYIEHKKLNEGARRKYMNKVNREVRLQKSGDAFMKMASGDERHVLLEEAITGWNLGRIDARTNEVKPISFSTTNLKTFLDAAAPSVVDMIEKDIREQNPWLTGDVTVEDIDSQIKELEDLRDKKVAEAEGNES